MIEDVKARLRERIKRGATFDELETVIRLSRGLRQQERWELWSWAWSYDPDADKRPRRRRGSVRNVLGRGHRPGLRPRLH
jgi:hypothetical protein